MTASFGSKRARHNEGCQNLSLRRAAGKREMTSMRVPAGGFEGEAQSRGQDPFNVAPLLASRRAPTAAKPMPGRSLRILAAAPWSPLPGPLGLPRKIRLKKSLAFSGTVADIHLRLRLFVDVLSTFNSARDNTGGFRLSAVSPIEVFGHVDRAQPPRVLVALEGSSDPDTRSCMWHVVL